MKRNIYLGIDGVILTRGTVPALHLEMFLSYILTRYSVSWLSSRCRGKSEETVNYLSQFLPPTTINLIRKIKPTNFDLDKTEAIDFTKRFFLLDGPLFDSEKNTLKKYGKYDSWIELDLIKKPHQLLNLTRGRFI